MTTTKYRCGVLAAAVLVALLTSTPAQAVTLWTIHVAAGSQGQSHSGTITTTTTTAHCAAANSTSINVTWTAVPHAATYTVFSATAAAGPYNSVASGLAGTSYTATGATGHSYWFEVEAVHNAWTTTSAHAGPVSVASGPSCTG